MIFILFLLIIILVVYLSPNMTSPSRAPCPHCPGSSRLYITPRGLNIHISRAHKDIVQNPSFAPTAFSNSASLLAPSTTAGTQQAATSFKDLPFLKANVRVLNHIPKGARCLAAGKLCDIIENCLRTNDVDDWFALLSFSFSSLRVPESKTNKSLTTKVKENVDNSCLYFPEECLNRKSSSNYRIIESKVHEGDLRGAVRMLLSDSALAPIDNDTLNALCEKHPSPSRTVCIPPEPDRNSVFLTVTPVEVANALHSFYNGSAAGLDGLRPQHLKELTSASAGNNGSRLLESLTKLCNFLLKGMLNLEVRPYLYGASLCALSKKDGGVRPIAVGSVIRRLTAKLCCYAARQDMSKYLQPKQVGFGTAKGCEAAIHATRSFALQHENTDTIIVKLDLKNAFNCAERDTILKEVLDHVPRLYPFLYQCYSDTTNLYIKENLILSQVGAQQGDPLGPLIFCLAMHKAISDLSSTLNIWYLDDGTIGGRPDTILEDLKKLIPALKNVGLEINPQKCELFTCGPIANPSLLNLKTLLPGIKSVDKSSFSLLGAPIYTDGVSEALQIKKKALIGARSHLVKLSSHVSLTLLRNCFATPRMTYLLRTSPSWLFINEARDIDRELRLTAELLLNTEMSEIQWVQAALPIRYGGLGIRRVEDVGLVAFLASAHGTADLVTNILSLNGDNFSVPFLQEAHARWAATITNDTRPENPSSQRQWDDLWSKYAYDSLLTNASGVELARLKALAQPESGAWLHAIPSAQLGTFLDNNSLRIATALRLGAKVCEAHRCRCGAMVGENGHHGLSCQRCAGRFPRHHAINEIIRRAMVSANIPCMLEPPGLSRSDGKRPDGLTLVPWRRGRCLLWDATCVSTFAASHLRQTSRCAGSAAEAAAKLKHTKYSALEPAYDFVPVAIETAGPWGSEARRLFKELGRRLHERGCDPRSGSYLVQQVSIAVQRGNAAGIMGTFEPGAMRGGEL